MPEEPRVGDTYPMSTVATLVVGQDGSATKNSSSANITSKADRTIFLNRRRQVDVIIIGGNTARNEPYKRTPVPVIVCSRGSINPVAENPIAKLWNCSPSEAVNKARKLFGENILIEGGPQMIVDLVNSEKIDQLELSLTQVTGGENIVDWQLLLSKFKSVEMKQIDDTHFYSAFN
jgi:riboflavin biosynthesis pyrimidine reductase